MVDLYGQTTRSIDTGRMLARAFRLAGGRPRVWALTALFLLAFALMNLALQLGGFALVRAGGTLPPIWYAWLLAFFNLSPYLIVHAFATVALAQEALAAEAGDARSGFVATMRNAAPRTVPVAFINLAYLVIFAFAWVVLILPTIAVSLNWALAGPVRASERGTWLDAFGRSSTLAEGNRGGLFIGQIVFGLITLVVVVAMVMLLGTFAQILYARTGGALSTANTFAGLPAGLVIASVVTSLFQVLMISALIEFNAAFSAAAYVEMRLARGTLGTAAVEKVFA